MIDLKVLDTAVVHYSGSDGASAMVYNLQSQNLKTFDREGEGPVVIQKIEIQKVFAG